MSGRRVTQRRKGAKQEVDAPTTLSRGAQDALSLIGAWSDLDWEQLAADLDRLDHETRPTPPIDLEV